MNKQTNVQHRFSRQRQRLLHKLLALILAVTLSTPALALEIEGYPFVLEGDEVEFNSDSGNIEATGNVSIKHEDYTVKSDRFRFIAEESRVEFEGNIILKESKRKLTADRLYYNFKARTGEAQGLRSVIDGAYMTGDKLTLSTENATLENASFSTCNRPQHKHQKIRADSVDLYFESGDIVGRNNALYFLNFPIFYWPNLVYHSGVSDSESERTNRSIPEIGSNPIDGAYIHLNNAYFLTPKSTGTVTVGTSFERGFLYGFRHQYSFTDDHRLIVKAFDIAATGFEGGGIFETDLFEPESEEDDTRIFDQLFRLFSSEASGPKALFSVHYLLNEPLNYELVDIKPMARLKLLNFSYKDYEFNSIFEYGYFKDELAETTRGHLEPSVEKSIRLTNTLDLETGLFYIGNWYGNDTQWHRSFGKLGLHFDYENVKPSVTYTQLFINSGESPFVFDTNNEILNNEIGMKVPFYIDRYILMAQLDYDLEKEDFRNMIYTLAIKEHCWQWYISTNTVWKDLRFGISLLDSL